MTAMFRPVRWGTATMIALFTGAIAYNVFFIQASVHRQIAARDDGRPGRLGSFVAEVNGDEAPAGRMVRVSVRPSGTRGKGAGAAFSALVLATQRELAALGHFSGRIDGIYGKATREAIARYQRQAGLSVTGRPDQATLDHLQYDRRLAQAAKYTASINPAAPEGDDVSFVQYRLAQLGYAPGAIDGRIGPATRKAIRQFQTDRGWPATGEIDARLLAALKR